MTFQLYDEQLGRVVPFEPINPPEVSIYSCGLTVQSAPHLGHLRKEVVSDVLKRWLGASGYQVKLVINITDINEKIETKARTRNIEWFQLAYEVELDLHQARRVLGIMPPDYEPRASGHISEQIALVARLIERGYAYAASDGSGDVYFDVRRWSEYGQLSNQSIDAMLDGEEIDTRGKHDAHDFTLWKGAKSSDPPTAIWPSPWGQGRPGWHLECSVMAVKYLGDTFDIHSGGLDLKFPHHENEQAQAHAAGYGFARHWMHNAFLTQAGEKMSKSLGNTASVTELARVYPPRALRLYLIAPHYRSIVGFSDDALVEATTQLERIDGFLARAGAAAATEFNFDALPTAFVAAMNSDLGTPAAFAVLFDTLKAGNKALDAQDTVSVATALRAVRAMLQVLGLDPYAPEWAESGGNSELNVLLDTLIRLMLEQRAAARERKDWSAADAIRDQLIASGVKVEDSPTGVRWSIG
ncbi:MAG: cysteine--tRNA ligase [Propionibacteriaceae bacterium]|jgi:cysteinyl-tRNA synthetase|nr:cysteine--tRNA ligase [Propionibacteriaceae bacterium]